MGRREANGMQIAKASLAPKIEKQAGPGWTSRKEVPMFREDIGFIVIVAIYLRWKCCAWKKFLRRKRLFRFVLKITFRF